MKHFYLLGLMFVLILIPLKSFSQKAVLRQYDAVGNLTEKVIRLGGLKSAQINKSIDSTLKKDNSFKSGEIRIYPNPTRGVIEIELPTTSEGEFDYQFTILDMNGKVIIDKRKEPSRTSLDLSGEPQGLYFLHIRQGNVISKWKIIKE
jgi:hypothetical protein